MELIEDQVWCDVHGCIHYETTDPYEMGFESTGEEPECNPVDWRKLWIGGQAVKPNGVVGRED